MASMWTLLAVVVVIVTVARVNAGRKYKYYYCIMTYYGLWRGRTSLSLLLQDNSL